MPEIPHYFEQAARAAEIMQDAMARVDRFTAELETWGWTVERFEDTVIIKAPAPLSQDRRRTWMSPKAAKVIADIYAGKRQPWRKIPIGRNIAK